MEVKQITNEAIFLPAHQFFTQMLGNLPNMLYHSHTFFEIAYIVSGNADHLINGHIEQISAGDVLFLRPGDMHMYICNENNPEFLHRDILLGVPLWNRVLDFLDNESIREMLARLPCRSRIGNAQLQFLEEEFTHIDASADPAEQMPMLLSATVSLLSSLLSGASNKQTKGYPLWLSQLISQINTSRAMQMSKRDITRLMSSFSYNPSYISRTFKKYTGVNMSEYINDLRFSTAYTLLQYTDFSVEKVIEYIGLNNKSYFYREFKQRYHMTPKKVKAPHIESKESINID